MYINLEELKQDVTNSKGHMVTDIWNITELTNGAARNYKETLSMFFVESKAAADNKNIYDIKFLLQYKIKFEQPHARREVPQCSKC